MAFNHFAKLKRIIDDQPVGWYIRRIDEPTTSQTFKGEITRYDHYYRLYDHNDEQIKFGKFQKIEKLASVLKVPVEALPVVELD